jgi:hypothetical protein
MLHKGKKRRTTKVKERKQNEIMKIQKRKEIKVNIPKTKKVHEKKKKLKIIFAVCSSRTLKNDASLPSIFFLLPSVTLGKN